MVTVDSAGRDATVSAVDVSAVRITTASTAIPQSEWTALYQLFLSANGTHWRWTTPYSTYGYPWNFTSPMYQNPCNESLPWQGIACVTLSTMSYVTIIDLTSYNLRGKLPDSLGMSFTMLDQLIFYKNYLSGTIPSSLGLLTTLTVFDLGQNLFVGSIPHALTNLLNLTELYINKNKLTGTISSAFGNMSRLQIFDLDTNMLHGPLPSSMGQWRQLQQCWLQSNLLTGPIPDSFRYWTELQSFALNRNDLTGTIPEWISGFTQLIYLTLNSNHFIGSIPDVFAAINKLQILSLRENRLTGSLPLSMGALTECVLIKLQDNLLNGTLPSGLAALPNMTLLVLSNNLLTQTVPNALAKASKLNQLLLDGNHFTGTLNEAIEPLLALQILTVENNAFSGSFPNSLCEMILLEQVLASYNHFSGTFPSGCVPQSYSLLYNLQLTSNQLTGSLPTALVKENLVVLYLDQNQFSGTIPEQFFARSHNLSVFVMSINCLRGHVPDTLCRSQKLVQLSLDGLHSSESCERLLFPFFDSGYYLTESMHGTIPECITSKRTLQYLSLSGNSLTGTVPPVIGDSSMTQLILSNNLLSGTLADNIWNGKISYLDISFNRLRDTIPVNAMNSSFQENATVYLQVNRLSGTVNRFVNELHTVKILEGNMFGCNQQRSDIPYHDPSYHAYNCGSHSTNVSLLACTVCIGAVALGWFVLHNKQQQRREWWQSMVLWTTSYSSIVISLRRRFKGTNQHTSSLRYDDILNWSLHVAIVFWLIGAFFLLPIYAGISVHNSILVHTYIWKISATYMSGVPEACSLLGLFYAIVLVIGWILPTHPATSTGSTMSVAEMPTSASTESTVSVAMATPSIDIDDVQNSWKLDSSHSPSDTEVTSGSTSDATAVAVVPSENSSHQQIESIASTVAPSVASSWMPGRDQAHSSSRWRHIRWYLIAGFSMTVMLIVNASFVSATIANTYSPQEMALIAILLSLFKLFWSRVFILLACRQDVLPSWLQFDVSTYALILLAFGNNVVVPFLAELVAAPDCFLYAIVQPDPVSLSIPQVQCNANTTCNPGSPLYVCITAIDCSQSTLDAQITENPVWSTYSYVAPFHYSYECSSALISTFAPVFVYRSLMSILTNSFIPVMFILLHRNVSNEWARKLIVFMTPTVWKPELQVKKKIARISNHITLSNIAISFVTILTFGVPFPPLIFLCSFNIVVDVWAYRWLIGRELVRIPTEEEQWTIALSLMKFGFPNEDVIDILTRSVWACVVLASLFWAWLLFDTMGDKVGGVHATWIATVMAVAPMVLFIVRRQMLKWKQWQHEKTASTKDPATNCDKDDDKSRMSLTATQRTFSSSNGLAMVTLIANSPQRWAEQRMPSTLAASTVENPICSQSTSSG